MKQAVTKIKSSYRELTRGEWILNQAPFALLLCSTLLLYSERNLLWGVDNVFFRYGQKDGVLSNAIYRLYYAPEFSDKILPFNIVCCLLSLIPLPLAILPRFGAWLTALMLYVAAPAAYNNLMPVLLLVSFVSIGLCLNQSLFKVIRLRYWLHVFLRAHSVLFVVAFTCFALGNEQWLSGQSFYYAVHHDAMIRPWVLEHREILGGWSGLVSYSVLVFAILFPLLMMKRSFRIKGIYIGIVIVLVYGLLFNSMMNTLTLALMLLPWGIDLPLFRMQSAEELQQS